MSVTDPRPSAQSLRQAQDTAASSAFYSNWPDSAAEVEAALEKIGYTLKPGDIVPIQTGADQFWGQRDYFDAGAGMSAEATRWLLGKGIRTMGIDAWGWDQPFWAMRERFQQTGDPGLSGKRTGWGATWSIVTLRNWRTWIRCRSCLGSRWPASLSS